MIANKDKCDEYKKLYKQLIKLQRKCQVVAHNMDALSMSLLEEADADAGAAVDFWGDGKIKPAEDCKLPPGVKRAPQTSC